MIKHMISRIFSFAVCFWFAGLVFGQGDNAPHLVNQGLLAIEDRILVREQWSTDGQYIAAVARYNDASELATDVFLWDISNSNQKQFEPINSISFQDQRHIDIAFSSDSEYLAIRQDGELTIYTVPELEPFRVMKLEPFPSYGVLTWRLVAWSTNDQWVLIFDHLGQEFIAWNIITNEQVMYDTEYQFNFDDSFLPNILSVDDFWIITGFRSTDNPPVFMICDRKLISCESHSIESDIITSTTGIFDYMVFGIWRAGNFIWQADSNLFSEIFDEDINVYSISRQGQYLFEQCVNNQESRIIDFNTRQIVNMIQYRNDRFCGQGFLNDPVWFPDENHFIMLDLFNGLKLYEVGIDEPIQELIFPPLPEGVEGFGDLTRLPIINGEASMIITNVSGFIYLVRIENK